MSIFDEINEVKLENQRAAERAAQQSAAKETEGLAQLNEGRKSIGLQPIARVEDLPDRPIDFSLRGGVNAVKELGTGLRRMATDRFPADIASTARNVIKDGPPVKDEGVLDRFISEQKRDEMARIPSRQELSGKQANVGLVEGPASVGTSIATGIGGMVAGGAAGAAVGSAVPVVGTAVGGTVGGVVGSAGLSGAAFYNLAKDNFLMELRDDMVARNPNLTEEQWTAVKDHFSSQATKMGLAEAGPEALSAAFSSIIWPLGKGVLGIGKATVNKAAATGVKKALAGTAKAGAKMVGEGIEETGTEFATYNLQQNTQQDVYGKQNIPDPSFSDFSENQLAPILVGTLLTGGMFSAANRIGGSGSGGNGRGKVDPVKQLRDSGFTDQEASSMVGLMNSLEVEQDPAKQNEISKSIVDLQVMVAARKNNEESLKSAEAVQPIAEGGAYYKKDGQWRYQNGLDDWAIDPQQAAVAEVNLTPDGVVQPDPNEMRVETRGGGLLYTSKGEWWVKAPGRNPVSVSPDKVPNIQRFLDRRNKPVTEAANDARSDNHLRWLESLKQSGGNVEEALSADEDATVLNLADLAVQRAEQMKAEEKANKERLIAEELVRHRERLAQGPVVGPVAGEVQPIGQQVRIPSEPTAAPDVEPISETSGEVTQAPTISSVVANETPIDAPQTDLSLTDATQTPTMEEPANAEVQGKEEEVVTESAAPLSGETPPRAVTGVLEDSPAIPEAGTAKPSIPDGVTVNPQGVPFKTKGAAVTSGKKSRKGAAVEAVEVEGGWGWRVPQEKAEKPAKARKPKTTKEAVFAENTETSVSDGFKLIEKYGIKFSDALLSKAVPVERNENGNPTKFRTGALNQKQAKELIDAGLLADDGNLTSEGIALWIAAKDDAEFRKNKFYLPLRGDEIGKGKTIESFARDVMADNRAGALIALVDQKGWLTNGKIAIELDEKQRKDVLSLANRMGVDYKDRQSPNIDAVIPKGKKLSEINMSPIAAMESEKFKTTIVAFNKKSGEDVFVDGDLLGIVLRIFPDSKFYQDPNRNKSPLRIERNGKVVGVLMPFNVNDAGIEGVNIFRRDAPDTFEGPRQSTSPLDSTIEDVLSGGVAIAEKAVEGLRKNWTNGPKNWRIVQSIKDVPEDVRRGNNRMRGAYDPATDTVWIVTDNLGGASADFVALHEVIGHRGLEAVIGEDRAREFYDEVARKRAVDIRRYASEKGLPLRNEFDKRTAAMEWLADRIGAGELDLREAGFLRRLWTKLKAAVLRMTGRRFSDAELAGLVLRAHGWTERGDGKAVRLGTLATAQSSDTKQDQDYLAAVERGDMETAQKMVDEAAKKAGYNIKGYHGTETGGFNKFRKGPTFITSSKGEARAYSNITDVDSIPVVKDQTADESGLNIPDKFDMYDAWSVFTDYEGPANVIQVADGSGRIFYWNGNMNPVGDREYVFISDRVADPNTGVVSKSKQQNMARGIPVEYKPEVKSVYVRMRNPLVLGAFEANQLGARLGGVGVQEMQKRLIDGGYDGIETLSDEALLFAGKEVKQWVVFDPSQIKSADPVVRDDAGNVIPLSQRFNPQSDDIRYSTASSYLTLRRQFVKLVKEGKLDEATAIVPEMVGELRKSERAKTRKKTQQRLYERIDKIIDENKEKIRTIIGERAAQQAENARNIIERERQKRVIEKFTILSKEQAEAAKQLSKLTGENEPAGPARESVKKAYQTGKDVGAERGFKQGEKVGIREGIKQAIDQARGYLEELTGQEFDDATGPKTIKSILNNVVGSIDLGKYIDGAIVKTGYRGMAQATYLEGVLQQLEPIRDGLNDDSMPARDALAQLFGRKRATALVTLSKGDVQKLVDAIEDRAGAWLQKHYAKVLGKLIKGTDPKTLWNDSDSEPGTFDLMKQWEDALREHTEFTAKAKELGGKLREAQTLKLTQEMAGEDTQAIDTAIAGLRDELRAHLEQQNWRRMKALYEELVPIKKMSGRMKRENAEQRRKGIAENSEAIATEIAEMHEMLPTAKRDETPSRRGLFKHLLIDLRGDLESMTMNMGATAKRILFDRVKSAQERMLNAVNAIRTELESEMQRRGVNMATMVEWNQMRKRDVGGGKTVNMSDAQVMNLLATMLDKESYNQLMANGFKPGQSKAIKFKVRGESFEVTADIVNGLVSSLSREQMELVGIMRGLAQRLAPVANRTVLRLTGMQKFFNDTYWPRSVDTIDRKFTAPTDLQSLANIKAVTSLMGLDLAKERVTHSAPFVMDSIFNVFDDHIAKMSALAYMGEEISDAIGILKSGNTLNAMNRHFGTRYANRIYRTLLRAAGLEKHSQNWNELQRQVSRLERYNSVRMLGYRASSVLNNWIGGSIYMAGELAKIDPKLAAGFSARAINPLGFFKNEKNAQIAAELMERGYFKDRWENDLLRVFGNLPTDDEFSAVPKGKIIYYLRRLQRHSLSFMAMAEMKNAVAAYRTLVANGYSQQEAAKTVEDMTRRTQNPSTALEESGFFTILKQSGFGLFLPFFGQTSVAGNMLLKDYLAWSRDKSAKNTRNLAITLASLGSNIVFTIGLRYSMALAAKGLLTGDDDEEEKERLQEYALVGAIGESLDVLAPGAGRALEGFAGDLGLAIKSSEGDPEAMWQDFIKRQSSFARKGDLRSPALEAIAGIKDNAFGDVARGISTDNQERLERGLVNIFDSIGIVGGLPTGGIVQAVKFGAGLADEPIGKVER